MTPVKYAMFVYNPVPQTLYTGLCSAINVAGYKNKQTKTMEYSYSTLVGMYENYIQNGTVN